MKRSSRASVLNVLQQLHVEVIEPLLLIADQCIGQGKLVALSADPLHDHFLVVLLEDLTDALDHLFQGEVNLTSLETSHIVTVLIRKETLHEIDTVLNLELMVIKIVI